MRPQSLPYHIGKPPRAIRKAKLDNIALVPASLLSRKGKYQIIANNLVPASLLSRKGKYQIIANNLPGQGVLICEADKKEKISRILERVADFFRQNGHFVKTLPYSLLL